jgi:hypothetical protein
MGYSVPRVVATVELDVISPESKELEKERSKDEEIVNTALVQLLVCITLCSGIGTIKGREGLKWLPRREVFRLGPAGKPVCEARTDGVLRKMGNPKCTLAILEVKPYTRRSNLQRIEWQEACQMAAWISTSLGEKTAEKRREGILRTSGWMDFIPPGGTVPKGPWHANYIRFVRFSQGLAQAL